jgi:hypothetical protein
MVNDAPIGPALAPTDDELDRGPTGKPDLKAIRERAIALSTR